MPYASDNKISKQPIPNGIEITKDEYNTAFEAITKGKKVVVRSGTLRVLDNETRTVYSTSDRSEKDIPLNEDIPTGYTATEPGKYQEWVDGSWTTTQTTKNKLWNDVREERDKRLKFIEWRYNRYNSEVRQGLTPTDNISVLDTYAQALRDLPQTYNAPTGDPENVVFPEDPF